MSLNNENKHLIEAHTKAGMINYKILKSMMSLFHLPDVAIEKYILSYVGVKPYPLGARSYTYVAKRYPIYSSIRVKSNKLKQ